MQKHRNRIELRTAHGDKLTVSRQTAVDMLARSEAIIVQLEPLVIREARFLDYRDEARRRRGRIIPGVEHPDPDRIPAPIGRYPRVFDHHPVTGPDQGRHFHQDELPELEAQYRAYRRAYLRRLSEAEYERAERRRDVARRRGRRNQALLAPVTPPDPRLMEKRLERLARR